MSEIATPDSDYASVLNRRVLHRILNQSAAVLNQRGLRHRAVPFGSDEEVAILLLVVTLIAGADYETTIPQFLQLCIPLLAKSPAEIEALAMYFESDEAQILLRDLLPARPPIAQVIRPAVDSPRSGFAAPEVRKTPGPMAPTSDVRAGFFGGLVKRLLKIWRRLLSYLRPTERMARLVRQRLSEMAPVFTLLLESVDSGAADARGQRKAAVSLSTWEDRGAPSLDILRTVEATSRQGGLFTPRWRTKKREIEYLVLIQSLGQLDFEQARLQRMLQQLSTAGVPVASYYYVVDPRHLREFSSTGDGTFREVNLTTVMERHGDSRLAVFSTGHELFHPLTMRPLSWAKSLSVWPKRALLTPTPVEHWGVAEQLLRDELGFSLVSSRPRGLIDMATAFGAEEQQKPESPSLQPPQSELMESTELRYVTDFAPSSSESANINAQLQMYLGQRGYEWLALCCLYPQLDLNLAIHLRYFLDSLDHQSAVEFAIDEDILARMASLVWFRHGFLPTWLRRGILDSLARQRRRAIRKSLSDLLSSAHVATASGRPSVATSTQEGLRLWGRGTNDEVDFQFDAVMVDFLLDGPTRDIDPLLKVPQPEEHSAAHSPSAGNGELAQELTTPEPRAHENVEEPTNREANTPSEIQTPTEGPSPPEPVPPTLPPPSFAPAESFPIGAAFVPGYEYDVYVSYAHVDDVPVVGAELGWVSTLQRNLFMLLSRRLGRRDIFRPFTDHRLRGHDDIDTLLEVVRDSATLVVVLSPGWAESTYCQDELRNFLARQTGDRLRDVFVVEMLKLTGRRPEGLPNLRDYDFWYEDERGRTHTYAYFNYKDPEVDYGKRLDQLAQELADHLRALRAAALAQLSEPPPPLLGPTPPEPAQPRPRVPIVLAEVTDDLVAQRADLSTYLRNQNYEVLPAGTYRWLPPAEAQVAVTRDIGNAAAFVQLLGETPGYTDAQMPFGFPWLQHQIASELGAKIIQWRKPDMDLQRIELPEYRALASGETVHEMPLHDFMRFVVDYLNPVPRLSPTSTIFLVFQARDRAIAARIQAALADEFVIVSLPLEGSATEVRALYDRYMTECETVILIHSGNAAWERAQIARARRLAPRRTSPVRWLLLDIAPQDAPPLDFAVPNLSVIVARDGIGPKTISQLSRSLQ
jgi:hypothetical protein